MKAICLGLFLMLGLIVAVSPPAAQGQTEIQKARRCATLAGIADYYLTRRGEGSGGPNMIVLGARLDCDKGAYDKGIRTLEQLLLDKRIPLPSEP